MLIDSDVQLSGCGEESKLDTFFLGHLVKNGFKKLSRINGKEIVGTELSPAVRNIWLDLYQASSS